ncbi:unnamed protein product [Pleuronectes platessa]|uniref:Uncharacterized protein n=1 Tax=Pleuronectes platessa TaxID=8262 RepID=A0A9N7VYP5_PLEPL|nr:unnamed protein product [Pleuronectes platessa]
MSTSSSPAARTAEACVTAAEELKSGGGRLHEACIFPAPNICPVTSLERLCQWSCSRSAAASLKQQHDQRPLHKEPQQQQVPADRDRALRTRSLIPLLPLVLNQVRGQRMKHENPAQDQSHINILFISSHQPKLFSEGWKSLQLHHVSDSCFPELNIWTQLVTR